jgi:amino acid transporter
MCAAELSSIFPKSAAEYIFAKNIFDNDFVASIIGCLRIFVVIVSAATVATGFSQYLSIFLTQLPTVFTAMAVIAILSAVSFHGISELIRISTIFTFVERLLVFGSVQFFYIMYDPSNVLPPPVLEKIQALLKNSDFTFDRDIFCKSNRWIAQCHLFRDTEWCHRS